MTQILKEMFINRTRLILTLLAVTWGTFSITSMLAVGEGLRLTFGQVVNHSGSGALVVTGKQTTKVHHGQSNGIKILLTQLDLEQLKSILSDRAEITGAIEWDLPVSRGNQVSKGPPINAVESEYGKIRSINLWPGGRFINKEDEQKHRQVIVLGDRTKNKLFKADEDPIGQIVYLKNKPFLVIGTQKKSLQLIMTSQYSDEFTNWIPYSTYQELTHNYNYSNFIIAPKDLSQVPQLQEDIRHFIAKRRAVDPEDSGLLEFINLQTEKQKINLFFYGIEMVFGIIGGLTLMIAGVGIANVMAISVRRATREIGIRMALGATSHVILAYYAAEALLTTGLGGACGLALTKLLVIVVNHIPMNAELLQYIGTPRPIMSWRVLLIVIIVLGLIGLFSGLLPARKAASINPAEALRYE